MTRDQLNAAARLQPMLGSNPLLETLGEAIPYHDIPEMIASYPLQDIAVESVPLAYREDLLALRMKHFIPTSSAISIVAAMQVQLREHYISRNPHDPEVRRKLYELASYKNKEISELPWFPGYASGMIIQGITGTGKSTIWQRYVSLLPELRRFENGEIPGFATVTQIVWLKVDMSADGSRGGFLLSILHSVDERIGSNYFEQYSKGKWSVEKLMVVVGIILSVHFCGMLIVEEIQEENFGNSQWGKELATFFLRLLNFGISVVLVGNPLGFLELKKPSQLKRRLTAGGSFWLHPAETPEETDWKQSLVPKLWDFDIMPVKLAITPDIEKALYEYSGGINDFLVRLKVDAQRIALRLGDQSVELSHIEAAYNGPTFVENHDLIRAFVKKDIKLLSGIPDVPVEYYEKRWKKCTPESSPKEPSQLISPMAKSNANSHVPGHKTKESQYKRNETTAANRKKRVGELNLNLPEEDMRRQGGPASLVESIEDLKKRLGS